MGGRRTIGVWAVPDATLVPTGERTFFSPRDYGQVTVVVDDSGRAERLDWVAAGKTYPCPRVGDR